MEDSRSRYTTHTMDKPKKFRKRKARKASWKPSIPHWERDFCKEVGRMSWQTLLHLKKFIHMFNDVAEWDDSGAEEAFRNAKLRYWAKINGQPCGIPMPDPDLHIDNIDWDAQVQPEELLDIDIDADNLTVNNPKEEGDHEPVIIFGDALQQNRSAPPPGWGIEEEQVPVAVNTSFDNPPIQWPVGQTGWGDEENAEADGDPQAGDDQPVAPTGWDDEENQEVAPMGWGDEEEQMDDVQYPQITSTGWGGGERRIAYPNPRPYNPSTYYRYAWMQGFYAYSNAPVAVPVPVPVAMWPGYHHPGAYRGALPPSYVPWGGNWNGAVSGVSYGNYPSHGWGWQGQGQGEEAVGSRGFPSSGRGRGFRQPPRSG